MRRANVCLLAVAAVSVLASRAGADPVSPPITTTSPPNATLTGTLPNQGTPLEVAITLPTAAALTVYTTSYAGGGFEPNLSLFDGAGHFVAGEQFPGTGPFAKADPTTAQALDGYFTSDVLAAGKYTVTLTDFELQQDPSATNLSDGFTFNIGDGTTFVDEQGNVRTGNYALTLATSVPEPATAGLAALAAAGAIGRRRRR